MKCSRKNITKKQLDIGVVKDLLTSRQVSEAITYCQSNDIDEIEFAKIARDLEKVLNNTNFWAVVGESKDKSKAFYKGSTLHPYHQIVTQAEALDYAYNNENSAKKALARFNAETVSERFKVVYSIEAFEIEVEPFLLT